MLDKLRIEFAVLACLMASLYPVSPVRAATDATTSQEIAHLEDLYSQSFVTGNASVAEHLLAKNFIGYGPDAKSSDKASILAVFKSQSRPSSIKITALTVRLHGDTGIALGTEEDTMPGSPGPVHRRWLDTWKKTATGWRLVASAEIVPPS